MGVSKNSGTPKSSMLIGFSIINHPFWDTPLLETPVYSLFFFFFGFAAIFDNHVAKRTNGPRLSTTWVLQFAMLVHQKVFDHIREISG